MIKRAGWILAVILGISSPVNAEQAVSPSDIPAIYKNLVVQDGQLKYKKGEMFYPLDPKKESPAYTLTELRGNPKGTAQGFSFTFYDSAYDLLFGQGTLYYSLWDPSEGRFPTPKYRFNTDIKDGIAEVKIADMKDVYDFTFFKQKLQGILYYRVQDAEGNINYEGKFFFTGKGPFTVGTSIIEGPWIFNVTPSSAVITFETNEPAEATVTVAGEVFSSPQEGVKHEIKVTGLQSGTLYPYTVTAGDHVESYAFKTAPVLGSREKFIFAYGSDSREGIWSGERNFKGTNAYIMRKAMALAAAKGAAFFQFTGDMINGYRGNVPEQQLQYANWKRAICPWASRLPMFVGFGNHEALFYNFDDSSTYGVQCDRFPFATQSAEALFADEFVNPENGPLSEDDGPLDPDPENPGDFPSYKENVYYYTWGNVAVIVLNSFYVYSPSSSTLGGNVWAYIMDNQVAWLNQTLDILQADTAIDHIFVSMHTPLFTNTDPIYKNDVKPVINGISPEKITGYIDRRDQILRIFLAHDKAKAFLTADEHHYARMIVKSGMPIYGEYIPEKHLEITRPFWQITAGSVGAPYAYMIKNPWNVGYPEVRTYLKELSGQYALAFFHVHGQSLKLEVVNPHTLDRIE